MEYSIQELSRLSGVTTRTLRWYDQIGLLKPSRVAESGYGYYGGAEVDRLQDILYYHDEERAYVYGIVGGTPQYLLQMSDKLSIEDIIKNTFLNPSSALFEEPENLLKQEVREPALYNAIIKMCIRDSITTGKMGSGFFAKRLRKATNQILKNITAVHSADFIGA